MMCPVLGWSQGWVQVSRRLRCSCFSTGRINAWRPATPSIGPLRHDDLGR
ncbi:unnamed protein product, partial [Scytosiphon promiscuus]